MAELADCELMENDSDSDTSGIYFSFKSNKTIMPLNNESDESIRTEDELSEDNIMKRSPYYLRSSRSRSNSPEPSTSSFLSEEERFARRQTILPSEAENMFPKIQMNKSSKDGRLQEYKQKYDEFGLPPIEEIEDENVVNKEDPQNCSIDSSLSHSENNDPYVLNINVHIPKEFSDKDIPLHVNIIKDSSRVSMDELHDNNDTTMESNTSNVPFAENSTSMVSVDDYEEGQGHVGDKEVSQAFVRHESAMNSPVPSTSSQQHKSGINPSTSEMEHYLQHDHAEFNTNQATMKEPNQVDDVQLVDNKSKGKKKVSRKSKPKEEKKETKSVKEDKPKRKSARRSMKTANQHEEEIPEQHGANFQLEDHVLPQNHLEEPVYPLLEQQGPVQTQLEEDNHAHLQPEQHVPEQPVLEENIPEQLHREDNYPAQIKSEEQVPEQTEHMREQSTSSVCSFVQGPVVSGPPLKSPEQPLPEQTVIKPPRTQSLKDDLLELEQLKKERDQKEKKEKEEREKKERKEKERRRIESRAKHMLNKHKNKHSKKEQKKQHKKRRQHCHCCASSSSSDSSDSVCSVCHGEICGMSSYSSSSSTCECGFCSSSSSTSSYSD